MSVEQEIREALNEAFQPTALEVVNESHHHAGHSGDDGSGESHFAVRIRAASLAAMPRLARHRAVQQALHAVQPRIHALRLDIG